VDTEGRDPTLGAIVHRIPSGHDPKRDLKAPSVTAQLWGLAGIVLGALLGGGAQIVTVSLGHRHAIQREQIQLKRSTYLDLLSSAEVLMEATRESHRCAADEPIGDSYHSAIRAEYRAVRAFEDSKLALEMYSPPGVATEVQRLREAIQVPRNDSTYTHPKHPGQAIYEGARVSLIQAMRLDILVDRRPWWRRWTRRPLESARSLASAVASSSQPLPDGTPE